jgi:hypothetical protein
VEIRPGYRFFLITLLRVASATFFVCAGANINNFLPFLLLAIFLFVCAEAWNYFVLSTSKHVCNVLLNIMYRIFGFSPNRDVRCSLLMPSKIKQILKPIARCHGFLSRSKIPFGKGVAGECFSTKESIIEPITGDYHSYMLKRGFTEQEARQFKPRKSYLCVPIIKDKDCTDDPLGVISLDSSEADTFDRIILETIETLFVVPFYTLLKEKR